MNIFNKKTILFFSISTLMINGCVAKNDFKIKPVEKIVVVSKSLQAKPSWGKVQPLKVQRLSVKKSNTTKEDCIDCYATPMKYSKRAPVMNNTFRKILNKPIKRTYAQAKVIDTKSYGAYVYTETASDTTVKRDNYITANTNSYIEPAVSYVNSSYGSYSTSTNVAIQVGAFRKYSGAKIYMKRYNALSNKYKVTIKTGTKNNKPLHRVRIEGFQNKSDAKNFMYSYGISDAFVVRK